MFTLPVNNATTNASNYGACVLHRFLFMIEHVMPLVLVVSWVYSVAMLTQSVVYEKEQRLREV